MKGDEIDVAVVVHIGDIGFGLRRGLGGGHSAFDADKASLTG